MLISESQNLRGRGLGRTDCCTDGDVGRDSVTALSASWSKDRTEWGYPFPILVEPVMVLMGLKGRLNSGSLESSPPSSPPHSSTCRAILRTGRVYTRVWFEGAQSLVRWGAHCPSLWWPCGSHPPEEAVGGGAAIGDVVEEDLQFLVIVKVSSDDGADR